jgi:hypothetical protein
MIFYEHFLFADLLFMLAVDWQLRKVSWMLNSTLPCYAILTLNRCVETEKMML